MGTASFFFEKGKDIVDSRRIFPEYHIRHAPHSKYNEMPNKKRIKTFLLPSALTIFALVKIY
jgi:hypothetical protein